MELEYFVCKIKHKIDIILHLSAHKKKHNMGQKKYNTY
uniref:Uncharacterized protein n=1 Tax=Anguilla anguilla TaxID=7936 RepID=A0A0E9XJY9_ANGAN